MLDILANLSGKRFESWKLTNAAVEFLRASDTGSVSRDKYLAVWDRLWAASAKDPDDGREVTDPVGLAINDPAGKLTEELLKYLWPEDAKVGGGIPTALADRLTTIVHRTDHAVVDASSVIVASRAEVLHALDPKFAKEVVLPLLRWGANPNAASYWSAFLWPARISPDLFKLIEEDCMAALREPDHFEERTYERLCQIFLLASMEFKATVGEPVRDILGQIGTGGLEHMASFVRHRMQNAKKDAAVYWKHTVFPWLSEHWPRNATAQSTKTRESFAMVAIYSDDSFPKALQWLEGNGLLGETPEASSILFSLRAKEGVTAENVEVTSTLPERFPADVLRLLWITRPFQWAHNYAGDVLHRVAAADPALTQTNEYQTMIEQTA